MTIEEIRTVTIDKREYEKLVRDSERLNVVESYLATKGFKTTDTVELILGIRKENE